MSRPGSGQHTTLLSDPAFTGEVYEVRRHRAYALNGRREIQGEAGAGLMAGDYKASGPMLDSRRDCRYRRGAHRSIGVGLGKVTFHNMLGTSSGVPGFPLTPIHRSAWKGYSPKFACGLLDKVAWVRGGLITFNTNLSRFSARSYTSRVVVFVI